MEEPLTWGAFLPHGGSGEYDGWPAARAWEHVQETARTFDDLGFDHLWLSDHLMASGGDRSGLQFEAYTALAALAQVTSRARLGVMVTCAQYRGAGLLAKQAANVDVVSGGRLILGLGGGWDAQEFTAYGLPFPSPRQRVDTFAETLEAVLRLWDEPFVDFEGEHVRLAGASCNPRPAQRPPVWTGTHGPRGLRAAALRADVANWNVDLGEFRELSDDLKDACADVGRDPETIDTSVFRLADLSGDLDSLGDLLRAEGAPADLAEKVADEHFIGTPDDVVRNVQAFVDAGARHVVVMFIDATETTRSAQRFMEEVVPQVRAPVVARR